MGESFLLPHYEKIFQTPGELKHKFIIIYINTAVPHRKHITSPLQRPTG
jgi:hypothetical protein